MINRLRWFYFLCYAGVGCWLGYFAPYLRGLGFSGEEIGVLSMLQALVGAGGKAAAVKMLKAAGGTSG